MKCSLQASFAVCFDLDIARHPQRNLFIAPTDHYLCMCALKCCSLVELLCLCSHCPVIQARFSALFNDMAISAPPDTPLSTAMSVTAVLGADCCVVM